MLILLVLVFGSAIAAGLPLAIARISVVGTFLILFLLTLVTDVSIFSINLTTALGIGLGIDYSLFIVSRFREEMRNGRAPDDAVVRTVETAGRTVLFSALTVAISLSALLVFPMYFLRSFAYAGIAVVALALPRRARGPARPCWRRSDRGSTGWTLFRRKPARGGRGDVAPDRHVRDAPALADRDLGGGRPAAARERRSSAPGSGSPTTGCCPESASARQIQDQIRQNFTSEEASALLGRGHRIGPGGSIRGGGRGPLRGRAVRDSTGSPGSTRSTGSYLDGRQVARPAAASARFVGTDAAPGCRSSPAVEPISEDGEQLVATSARRPRRSRPSSAGPSAELVDTKDSDPRRVSPRARRSSRS